MSDSTHEEGHRPIPGWAWAATVVVGGLLTALILAWTLRPGPPRHATDRLAGYVGAQQCAECHPEQTKSWGETRMARSFDMLKPKAAAHEKSLAGLDPDKDYTHDKACLPCHTTGYGLVGGFRSIEETPQMAGVGCEACHGPGGSYVGGIMDVDRPDFGRDIAEQAGLVYPPTESTCRKCHNEKSPFVGLGYVFNFEERVSRGTHQHFAIKHTKKAKAD